MSNEILTHLIAGNAHADAGATQRTNINPATGETVSIAPMDAVHAADKAVEAAATAFESWSQVPVGDRIQHLFKYKTLLEDHAEELAAGLVLEHGKTMGESMGSVRRGIDCIEHACAVHTCTPAWEG